jgi:hypothetical protein
MERFKYWFTNVLWYHYRLHIIIGAAAAVILAVTIRSSLTNTEPDFIIFIVSEQPVFGEQGAALSAFFTERVEDADNIAYQASYLGDETQWQFLTISLIDDRYTLFIAGESMAGWFEQSDGIFYTAEELGVAGGGPIAGMIPLEGAALMEELMFVFEPMYAMVRRPVYDRRGFYTPDSVARSELAAECVRVLLDG